MVPWLKGKVERINRTFEEECLAEMPAFLHGPVGSRGQLLNRPGRAAVPSGIKGPDFKRLCDEAIPIRLLVQKVAEWVDWYNNERPHSALDGETPRQRWESDATPVELVQPELLRAFLLARKERKVVKGGIPWAGRKYWHEDLVGHVGEKVTVAHVPYEERWIDVYTADSEFICTAEPARTLTQEEAKEFVRRRRELNREVSSQQAASRRRHRERLSTMTREAADPEITNPAARGDAGEPARRLGGYPGLDTSEDMLDLHRFESAELGVPAASRVPEVGDARDEAAELVRELIEEDEG